ncbi:MAG: hypothetical protein ACRDTR_08415 [Rubrobacter sp.]
MVIGENMTLDENQKRRVLAKVEERNFTCGNCGADDFEGGDALYLGFLFLSEEHDNYMVALTCKEPDCETPRTGIKLREAEFLKEPDAR